MACLSFFFFSGVNMRFVEGYIEDLVSVGIEENSVDLVFSNCVVNLSTAKERVLSQVHCVLRPGGEFQFSDVFADGELSEEARTDKVLVGECLGGALEIGAFTAMAEATGFARTEMTEKTEIQVHDPELKKLVGQTKFFSITWRLFK